MSNLDTIVCHIDVIEYIPAKRRFNWDLTGDVVRIKRDLTLAEFRELLKIASLIVSDEEIEGWIKCLVKYRKVNQTLNQETNDFFKDSE